MIIALRVVTLTAQCLDSFGSESKQKEIFRPHFFLHFYVRAVQGPDRERAVQPELHIARARGLGAGREICSDRSQAGMIFSAFETL